MTLNNNPKILIGNHKEKGKWNSGTVVIHCIVSFLAAKAKKKLDKV